MFSQILRYTESLKIVMPLKQPKENEYLRYPEYLYYDIEILMVFW